MVKKTKGGPQLEDVIIGKTIKKYRNICGMSQTDMAENLNLSFQQIQKYEKGTNRVSAFNLYKISKVLNQPLESFFDEVEKNEKGKKSKASNKHHFVISELLSKNENLRLLRYYEEITDLDVKKDILRFIKSLSEKI